MSDYFTLQSSIGYNATTRGNPYKLFVNRCRINARKHKIGTQINCTSSLSSAVTLVLFAGVSQSIEAVS